MKTQLVSYKDNNEESHVFKSQMGFLGGHQLEQDAGIEFDAHPDNDELDTDRMEFYNLDSER